eukprot:Awhi_evm1s1062
MGGFKNEHIIKIVSVRFVGKNQDIVHLVATKPKVGFSYLAGSYAFIKVPGINNVEWHPFTIASTPLDEHLEFYIKNAGDWTNKLMGRLKGKALSMFPIEDDSESAPDYLNDEKDCDSQNSSSVSTLELSNYDNLEQGQSLSSSNKIYYYGDSSNKTKASFMSNLDKDIDDKLQLVPSSKRQNKSPKIKIFGPISSPAHNFRLYKYGLYIAAGVGITPYISILSYLYQKRQSKLNDDDFRKTSCPNSVTANSEVGSKNFIDSKTIENTNSKLTAECESIVSEMSIESNKPVNDEDFDDLKKQTLVWSSRHVEEFAMVSELLIKLSADRHFDIQLYLTSKSRNEEKVSLMASDEDSTFNILPKPLHRCLRYGRPDLHVIMENISEQQSIENNMSRVVLGKSLKEKHTKIGVFATVPDAYLKKITKACKDFHFDFHPESF